MAQTATHHAINYVEFTVTDLGRAKSFYSAAFGWLFTDYGPTYAGIQGINEGDPEMGGLLLADRPRGHGGPFVILYSHDLNASADAIRDAGGTVTSGPYEFPGGRRLHFNDPDGNELGVWSEV